MSKKQVKFTKRPSAMPAATEAADAWVASRGNEPVVNGENRDVPAVPMKRLTIDIPESLHARVGGFRPYRYVHDWDFALRAMVHGRAAYVQRFITAYRLHSHNTMLESQVKAGLEIRAMLDSFKAEFESQPQS